MNNPDAIASEPMFPIPRASGCPFGPPAQYDDIRMEGALKKVKLYDGRYAWLATRMDDVKAILTSPNISADPAKPGYPFFSPARAATVKSYKTLPTMDAPEHTKYRRMLTKDFTQKRMDELRPGMEKLVDEILDEMMAKGPPANLVKEFALRLPVTVISMLVGVPLEDDHRLVKWSMDRLNIALPPEMTERASKEMAEYFDDIVKRREENPGEGDLLSRLVIEQMRPGHLSRSQAVQMVDLMYLAGHETTGNQIALGVLTFLLDSEQRAKLKAKPELLENAVEEMLRYHSIAQYNSCRIATADVTIGDELIRAGEGVYALVSAANHDPRAFERPDKFDIERHNAQDHLTFSYGPHHCIGQPLVRLELQMVFKKIFERLPNLELAIPLDEVQFNRDQYINGVAALPVTW